MIVGLELSTRVSNRENKKMKSLDIGRHTFISSKITGTWR